jgi:malate dehydrogenase (oxaloacetate-decarboxylating)
MAIAAATELAACVDERRLGGDCLLPTMEDLQVAARVATATAMKAQEQGVAKASRSRADLLVSASAAIRAAREATRLLMDARIIPPAPPA